MVADAKCGNILRPVVRNNRGMISHEVGELIFES